MHFYTERLLGGFGIVTGQLPIATGAAFSIRYLGKDNEVAICFLGDGAVAQGSFHEALNLAALWDLPCIFVIENNQWGMGTHVSRAISVPRLAEDKAASFGIKGYTFDGMDYFNCHAGFTHVHSEVLAHRKPVLIEVLTQRFRGHSISDPGLYRSKEDLKDSMQRDPLLIFQNALMEAQFIDQDTFKAMDKEEKERIVLAMQHAEQSPWPDPITLEEDVFAP